MTATQVRFVQRLRYAPKHKSVLFRAAGVLALVGNEFGVEQMVLMKVQVRKVVGTGLIVVGNLLICAYLAAYAAEYFGVIDLGIRQLAQYVHGFLPMIIGTWFWVPAPLAIPLFIPIAIGLWIRGDI